MSIVSGNLLLPKQLSTLLDGGLVVSAGENEFLEEKRVLTPFRRGMTAAITLEGRLSCRIDDRLPIQVEAPSVSLILSDSEHRRDQVFAGGQTLRYVLVHISTAVAASHVGVPFEALLARASARDGGHAPAFITTHADAAIRSIASQIMVCPIQGSARDVFLLGKAMELIAYAIAGCFPARDAVGTGSGLSATEVERITMARDLLLRRHAEPLVMSQLAATVGLNAKALGVGFRRLFGTSIPEFLQEYRLRLAYDILAAGEAGVAEVAYRVGYTPAYLSTLFRARFGLSPRDLR